LFYQIKCGEMAEESKKVVKKVVVKKVIAKKKPESEETPKDGAGTLTWRKR
jgi:hypothetical protein